MEKTLDSYFNPDVCADHKHPLMSTGNRFHEFLVDDACALKCSGMVGKCE